MEVYIVTIIEDELNGVYDSLEKAEQAIKNYFESFGFKAELVLMWNDSIEWEYRINLNPYSSFYHAANIVKYKLNGNFQ